MTTDMRLRFTEDAKFPQNNIAFYIIIANIENAKLSI